MLFLLRPLILVECATEFATEPAAREEKYLPWIGTFIRGD